MRQAWAVVLVVTALRAVSRSSPVVSAMICAISGMQAVLPSVMGNSSTLRMGCAGISLAAEEAGSSASGTEGAAPELEEAGTVLQAESRAAVDARPRPVRNARREILTVRMEKPP